MEIFIASDHGGFNLKETIKTYLAQKEIKVIDMGAAEYSDEDDYPDYVIPLAKKVKENPQSKGIVICRNGVGVSIAVNKFKGIRAALSWDAEHVKTSKTDDDANVLALPSDYIDEETAKEIVDAWLNTPFSEEQRHKNRLEKIESLGV